MINASDLESVKKYLQENKEKIMQAYQSVGIAIGKNKISDNTYVIVVYLKDAQTQPNEPVVLDGIPLKFEVTGQFHLQK